MIFEAADRPNINKWPGVKFDKISLNYLDLWHFSPPYQISISTYRLCITIMLPRDANANHHKLGLLSSLHRGDAEVMEVGLVSGKKKEHKD